MASQLIKGGSDYAAMFFIEPNFSHSNVMLVLEL